MPLGSTPARTGETLPATGQRAVRLDERVADLPLDADDLAAVPLEQELRALAAEALPLNEKPS
jgi:hypothetical protein